MASVFLVPPNTMATYENIPDISGLVFDILADGIIVSGKTYYYREQLRNLGGEWDPVDKVWCLPITADIRNMQPQPTDDSREMVRRALIEKKETGRYHWICCEDCKVISWKTATTSCKTHSIRVRGRIYTGD